MTWNAWIFRFRLACLALLLAPALPVPCAGPPSFLYSRAPVADDPGPQGPPSPYKHWWPHISLREARRLMGRPGVVFVDGRGRIQWERSHLPGAILLPASASDVQDLFPRYKSRLERAKVVVCYCFGYNCGGADLVARLLAQRGLRNLAVYPGGFPEWQKAGYPLEGADFPPRRSASSSGAP